MTTGDGIRVVDAINGATTDAGAFSLGNRVAAGAYEYSLFRSGASDVQDWFLRSTYVGPVTPPTEPPVTTPTEPPAPAPKLPNYRAEVPVDMAVPALANRFGLAMLGTYHDRNGEDYADAATGAGDRRKAAWGRVFGDTGTAKHGGQGALGRLNRFERHGPSYDFDLAGFQAGLDLYRQQHSDGTRDTAGFSVGAGRITGDVNAVYGGKAGSVSMDGYTLGGYWTRKDATGWYVDAVVQGTWYAQIEATSIFGESLRSDGWGLAASLEGGIRSPSATAGQSSRRPS